jgi:hypothetical protein
MYENISARQEQGDGRLATCWACPSNNATSNCVPGKQTGHEIAIKVSAWLGTIKLQETRTPTVFQTWHIVSKDIVNTNLLSRNVLTKTMSAYLSYFLVFHYLLIVLQYTAWDTAQLALPGFRYMTTDRRYKPLTNEEHVTYFNTLKQTQGEVER